MDLHENGGQNMEKIHLKKKKQSKMKIEILCSSKTINDMQNLSIWKKFFYPKE